ncbi:biotin--[acetyl-CoA-carboxylase] ligase [Bifidobacterium callitrichos]|uniref:biotin--[acetyl-CoA-carboxylase] ligase n=1 Tax=Bifidobacterium callitrichos TaxID=762209 RepID=UPI000A5FD006|nr:biotin--[acetyl-CoA-carboxylase] ligase [Bifidobacterium callitrichos]
MVLNNAMSTDGTSAASVRMPATCRAADQVTLLDEVGSTNTLARQMVADGRIDLVGLSNPANPMKIAVVAADTQSAGRGRLDHTWTSRPGESFTVTFVVAVPRAVAVDESVNGWLQMIAGLCALDAIDDALAISGARPLAADTVGVAGAPRLKWPNDVYLAGRKLGGILAEMVPLPQQGDDADASSVAIVFGIGLNLDVPADRLPTDESTSLQLHYAPLPSSDGLRDAIAAGVVRSLRRRLAAFVSDPGRRAAVLLRETRERSYTLGRHAVAHFVDGTELEGVAEDLNPDASLILRTADGAEHTVHTADVGVLPTPRV